MFSMVYPFFKLPEHCPHMSKIMKIPLFCIMQVSIALVTHSLKSHKKNSQKNMRRKWDKHCNLCCWAREGSKERFDSSTINNWWKCTSVSFIRHNPGHNTDKWENFYRFQLAPDQPQGDIDQGCIPDDRQCWAPPAKHWLDWTSSDFTANSRYPELHKAISCAWSWWQSLAERTYDQLWLIKHSLHIIKIRKTHLWHICC